MRVCCSSLHYTLSAQGDELALTRAQAGPLRTTSNLPLPTLPQLSTPAPAAPASFSQCTPQLAEAYARKSMQADTGVAHAADAARAGITSSAAAAAATSASSASSSPSMPLPVTALELQYVSPRGASFAWSVRLVIVHHLPSTASTPFVSLQDLANLIQHRSKDMPADVRNFQQQYKNSQNRTASKQAHASHEGLLTVPLLGCISSPDFRRVLAAS